MKKDGKVIPVESPVLDGQKNPMSSLESFDHVLIWPMLCCCGFNTADVGPMFHKMVKEGMKPQLAMNLVGAVRICCRSTLMSPTTHVLINRTSGTVDESIFKKCKSSSIKYVNLSDELKNSVKLKEGILDLVPFNSHSAEKPREKTVFRNIEGEPIKYLEPSFIPMDSQNFDPLDKLNGSNGITPKSLINIDPPLKYVNKDQLRFSRGWAKDEKGETIMTHVGNNYFVPTVRLGMSNMFKFNMD